MYEAMKEAMKNRRGRGMHEMMNNMSGHDEPREALGLAPDSQSDVSNPSHLHDAAVLQALMKNAHSNPNPEMQSRDESMEQQGHNMMNPSPAEEKDENGNTSMMSHSGKVMDTALAGPNAPHAEVSHGMHKHEHDKMHNKSRAVETSREKGPAHGKFRSIKEAAGEARKRGM